MKKIMCILLSAVMASSMTACAFATETPVTAEPLAAGVEMESLQGKTTDQRLAEVASKVKATLGISDNYTEFYGDLWENELAPKWNLNWSREEDSISVEATEGGKVTSYSLSKNDDSYYNSRTPLPTFPAVSRDQAQKAAQAFLDKVLNSNETVKFSERSNGLRSTDTHRFTGTILINGLESPLTFSVSVRTEDGAIIRFYRDSFEGSYIGGIPSSTPNAGSDKAGELLKGTLSLRAEYVLEDGKAVLRFLPDDIDDFYVDAQTGKLVNLTELYSKVDNGETGESNGANFDAAMPEAAADKGAGGLTQVELEGISKLEGVLSKEDLDKKVRNISQLGLDKYTLATANYSLDKETDEVTARLSYTRRDGDDSWRRTISCDAKTGELKSVWSSAPYNKDRKASVAEDKARETAEAFLGEYWNADYAKTELYNSVPWENESWNASHAFIFAQKENGFFFPENNFSVSVDIEDGSISGFSRSWTEASSFESPDGILSDSAALDAWFNHYNLRMGYSRIPVKLDPNMSDAAPLLERGYSYFYSLNLTYTLAEPDDVWASGLNAKTGEIVKENRYGENTPIIYTDLDGYAGREKLNALADYGIGWCDEKCEPNEELNQLDCVALLVSTDGYLYNAKEDDVDDLYRRAYGLGILKANDRDDSRVMARGDVVKMILDCAGYGDIAKLPGIFSCAYPDAAQIPENLVGYAAIAQGLGIVGEKQEFAAGRSATRGEAAEMLYNFMDR